MPTAQSKSVPVVADVNILSVLAMVLAIPHIYHILDFIWLYFLRPSSVKRYLHGRAPYAIVTGATDGIGKATAAELVTRGFNVILHGRNEEKMRRVVDELRASAAGRASTPEIRYFIADATKGTHDWATLLKPFMDLHITVVIHNVTGGEDVRDERYVFIASPALVRTRLTTTDLLAQDRWTHRGVPPRRYARHCLVRAVPHAHTLAHASPRHIFRARGGAICRLAGKRNPASLPAHVRRGQGVPQGARARARQRRGAPRHPDQGALHVPHRGRGAFRPPPDAVAPEHMGADEPAVRMVARGVDRVRAEGDHAVCRPCSPALVTAGVGR